MAEEHAALSVGELIERDACVLAVGAYLFVAGFSAFNLLTLSASQAYFTALFGSVPPLLLAYIGIILGLVQFYLITQRVYREAPVFSLYLATLVGILVTFL